LNRATILFATSNRGKLEEAALVLGPLGFSVKGYDGKGVEIQADTTAEVAIHTAKQAASAAGRPVIVEDAGLFVKALNGFPGVYSAYALKTIGIPGVLSLLRKPAAREAKFVSSVAYCEPGGVPKVFGGSVSGTISSSPRGTRGFGFDPIFIPSGHGRTFGELGIDEKCSISHRGQALRRFAKWHASHER